MPRVARAAIALSPLLAVAAYLAYEELVMIPATQRRWLLEQHEMNRRPRNDQKA